MEPYHLIILTQCQLDVPLRYLNDQQANLFGPEFAFDGILLDQVATLIWISHLKAAFSPRRNYTLSEMKISWIIHAEKNNKFHSLNIFQKTEIFICKLSCVDFRKFFCAIDFRCNFAYLRTQIKCTRYLWLFLLRSTDKFQS